MRFTDIAILAMGSLPLLASAIPVYSASETATPSIAYTSTYSSYNPVKTHIVKVGGLAGNVTGGAPILRYDPEYVDGDVGDVVEFLFLANNHTATQADFNTPCFPKYGGFNTGFRPNKANILGLVSNTFTITDTNPAWFYCAQTAGAIPHCQAGMVFAINAAKTGDKTLDNFRKAAMKVPFVVSSSVASATSVTYASYSAPPYGASATSVTSYASYSPYSSYSAPPYGASATSVTSYSSYSAPPYAASATPVTSYASYSPYSSYSAPPYGTYAPARTTHYVTVGGLVDGNPKPVLRYNPETVNAAVGDVISFNFLAANHTVTQSSFDSPCVGIPDGFKTGVQMNPKNINGLIIKEFIVNDSKPLWFYCGFSNHCEQGMVFAINPLDKFPAFQAKAIASASSSSATPSVTAYYAAAYTTSSYVATTATYTPPRTTHYVTVGGLVDGNPKPVLRYNPETVNAAVGDVVSFNFLAANHTVTQSSFDSPCVGIPDGFKTGVQMNPKNINGLIIKEFIVNDSKPLWFYCGFSNHCQQGMVFAINPLDKFPAFQAKAIASASSSSTLATASYAAAYTTTSYAAAYTTSSYAAAYTTSYTASTTTYTPPRTTHYVTVGGLVAGNPKPVLRYNPETVNAAVGDVISFNFLAANHTVTQSSFDSPCVGIPDGFKTGVQMNPNNINGLIIKEFIVNDSKPLWFYCGFSNHCQQGMVFAINPLDKFPAFQSKAMASTSTISSATVTSYTVAPTSTGYY